MNNEFYLKYNLLKDYKYDNFDKYTKDMISAYSKADTLLSSLSINENLSYAWRKLLAKMDKLVEKRDKIDSWWTNYLENIRKLEQGLPDQVNQISNYNVHSYAMEHSVGNEPSPLVITSESTLPITESASRPAINGVPIPADSPVTEPNPELATGYISERAITGVPRSEGTAVTSPEPTQATGSVSQPAINGVPKQEEIIATSTYTPTSESVSQPAISGVQVSGGTAVASPEPTTTGSVSQPAINGVQANGGTAVSSTTTPTSGSVSQPAINGVKIARGSF